MFCNKCGTENVNGDNFCSQCGAKIERLDSISAEASSRAVEDIKEETSKGFWKKLSSGDFGLAKTYWLYGFVVSIVINAVLRPIESFGAIILIMIPYSIYEVFVLQGVWRASNRYTGAKIWAILAKIATVLGALSLLFLLLVVVASLLS